MTKPLHPASRFLSAAINYIASALILFYALSRLTNRWNYTINYLIGRKLFLSVLVLSLSAFVIFHRIKIKEYLGNSTLKFWVIAGILAFSAYQQVAVAEFLIFAYALGAIFFIRSFDTSRVVGILSASINNESRTPALFALICIITIPVLLILNRGQQAEQFAIYAYYFLVLTVILRILEMKYGIERNNNLLDLIKDMLSRGRDIAKIAPRNIAELTRLILLRGISIISAGFVALIILIIAIQTLYWNKLIKSLTMLPEYQYSMTLLDTHQEAIELAPAENEIVIPIRIHHPFSNPRVWSNTGANPVTISVLWFEKGSPRFHDNALFEEHVALERPLALDESQTVSLKLKRPLLPGDRTYDIIIDLVHERVRRFGIYGNGPIHMTAALQSSRGIKPLTRELEILKLGKTKMDDALSDRLLMHPDGYRSRIELLNRSNMFLLNQINLAITNSSTMSWPAQGRHPVQVGILWIQKIKKGEMIIFKHLDERHFPLSDTLQPGRQQKMTVNFNPFENPDADEIWIAMIHQGIQWFYEQGDPVLNIVDKRSISSRELSDVQKESLSILKEAQRLEKEQRILLTMINDPSIMEKDKYRYRISSRDASEGKSIQTARGRILDIDLTVTNAGKVAWPNEVEPKVTMGVLWFNKDANEKQYGKHVFEERCMLPFALNSGATANINCKLSAKVAPGMYEVWFSPVHEQVIWFFQNGDDPLKLDIEVTR